MTEYGIFDDQAADYSADEALVAQFYDRESAEKFLSENEEEYGPLSHVHEVEVTEDED